MNKIEQVTVILTYLNRADSLVRAAESVLRQTHGHLQLILVDDGSSDDSPAVARTMLDSRITHLRLPERAGVSGARNAGLDVATTPLVAFMDSDDVWRPEKLEVQLRSLRFWQRQTPDVRLVGCAWQLQGRVPTPARPDVPFARADVLAERVAGIRTPALLVDRASCVGDPRFDRSMPALVDRDFVMACLGADGLGVVVPETLLVVDRSRSDHVADARRAAKGYERLIDKYSEEIAVQPGLGAWYSFRYLRERYSARSLGGTGRRLVDAVQSDALRRSLHLLLAVVFGARGLSLAALLAPVDPPGTDGDRGSRPSPGRRVVAGPRPGAE